MYHYLTETGFKILKQQYDLCLNSKVAPGACDATGLWLSSEPESKSAPLIYSHGDCWPSERMTHVRVILCEPHIKQNKPQQIQSLNTFLQEVQKQ